ncbi:hypothetical protein P6144_00155 [Sphingomonas sp. HITSZ_GF]|uniref:hypothetical protein n=1 Tax=Sphingomonas sp. HITSZ_GF TaxID=3037247 RepID=UPI00240D9C4A|nr:hypothetical protein [Sphingomonas sp. HITSZ_GF]MDG2532047.1 hypothetical protein [Sphingomonas sp. HITSZ_GF]
MKEVIKTAMEAGLGQGQTNNFDEQAEDTKRHMIQLAKREGYTEEDLNNELGDVGEHVRSELSSVWDTSIDNSDND